MINLCMSVFQPRFEPGTSKIRVRVITVTPTLSLHFYPSRQHVLRKRWSCIPDYTAGHSNMYEGQSVNKSQMEVKQL
jgi:hypothetical protein